MLRKIKSIRRKVLLISALFFALFLLVNAVVEYAVVYPSFLSLERDEARENLLRVLDAIRSNNLQMTNTCRDWASWDETYDFAETRSESYITRNLSETIFTNNRIHLLYFFDTGGKTVWGRVYKADSDQPIVLTELRSAILPPAHPFFSYDTLTTPLGKTVVSGIWMTEFGPMLIAALPILTYENRGPSHGTLVMGRFLTESLLKELSDQTRVRFEIQSYDHGETAIPEATTAERGQIRLIDQSPTHLSAFTVLSDIEGNRALTLTADTPREISVRGFAAARFALLSNMIGMLGILGLFIVLLQHTVLKPITRLKDYFISVGDAAPFPPRLSLNRLDEIGTLELEFDKLLFRLDSKTSDLVLLNNQLRLDIEKRKAAEESLYRAQTELRANEERFRSYVENASDIIYTMNFAGTYTYITPNVETICGHPPTDLIGKNYKDVWHPDDIGKQTAHLERLRDNRKTDVQPPHRVRSKNGEWIWFTTSVSIIRNREGQLEFLGIARNITEQQRILQEKESLQERLSRAQKMEALGLLAGGVAHDLNNVLTGIASYPELLLYDLPEDSPFRNSIQLIQQSGQKASEIVQDLLALACRGVMPTTILNLNDIISEYLTAPEHEKLLFHHPGTRIQVTLADDLQNMRGGPIHLKKMIMNLVSNAAEAQPRGGTISIVTLNCFLETPLKGYDTVAAGEYAVVRIADEGIGIDPGNINRIFEPFYTKKVMGRSGTGLGMAVVWGTIQDHKGYIDIESDPGKGTTMTIFFPITMEAIPFSPETFLLEEHLGNGQTVLVVDDMKEPRLIASEIFRKAGYQVHAVSSGEQAVLYLSENPVDLVILDMIMEPGMDGLSTYREILKLREGQKAIIASGFSETDRVKEALKLGTCAYVRKPYTLEKILKAASAALRA